MVGGAAVSAPAGVQPNIIDRLVTFIDPVRGARRHAARGALAMSGAYTGARWDRRQTMTWFTSRGSADADTLPDIPELRARSRDLSRNNPLAIGAINTVVTNAAGTGLMLQSTPDREILGWTEDQARAWSKLVGHEFAMWAESKDCEVTRTTNFYDSQPLVFRSELESGDSFTILTQKSLPGSVYSTRFQIVEADRVRTPGAEGMDASDDPKNASTKNGNRIFGGVEQDAFGAPAAYCILKQHPGSIGFNASQLDYDRYVAFGAKTGRRNVLHHFDRLRPDQSRGVPYLAPVVELFKQLDRYTEAEIMAAVITAAYTVFVKTDLGDQAPGAEVTPASPVRDGELTLGNGKVIGLMPGEEIQFPNAMRPNAGFDPFVTSILRQIGVCLQLPFEILIKHFTASYSAARAAMLEAWKFYKNRRNHLAQSFCQPVFEAWMDEAVSIGRITAPGYFSNPLMRRAYLSADWIGDAPGQIDPLKEVQAADMRVQKGFSNLKIETMELTGRNWDDVHAERPREHSLRAAAGLEPGVLNATGTEPVPDVPDQEEGDSDIETPTAPPGSKKGGQQ